MAPTRISDRTCRRAAERHRVSVAARLTWKDASGAVRFVSVTTRDISYAGAYVEAEAGPAIPVYRLVQLQLERSARDTDGVPERLREGRILAAVWRVGPCLAATGTPSGYALRFLVASQTHQATAKVAAAI